MTVADFPSFERLKIYVGSEETKNYFFILLKGVVVTKYCTYKVTMSVIELVKTPLSTTGEKVQSFYLHPPRKKRLPRLPAQSRWVFCRLSDYE